MDHARIEGASDPEVLTLQVGAGGTWGLGCRGSLGRGGRGAPGRVVEGTRGGVLIAVGSSSFLLIPVCRKSSCSHPHQLLP